MLAEIEDKLVKVLQEELAEIPKENIIVNAKPSKLPAVILSNLKFKFDNNSLAENLDQGHIQIEEKLDSDGAKTLYKLQEKPLKKSVVVESPSGTLLTEKDCTVNYKEGSIKFRKSPAKGKDQILVQYNSQKKVMTLKSLKVKALYAIDVFSGSRIEADSIAEKIVKALLTVDNHSLGEGVEIKPIRGFTKTENDGKTVMIQLKYVLETEIRVEQIVGLMEEIEIERKDILK
jgi:hypothetical protein